MKLELFTNPLECQVKFYIPTVDMHGANLNIGRWLSRLERLEHKLTTWFGGCTSTDSKGSFEDIADVIVTERIWTVEAFCSEEDLLKHEAELLHEARELKIKLDQESVAVEINHKLYLI